MRAFLLLAVFILSSCNDGKKLKDSNALEGLWKSSITSSEIGESYAKIEFFSDKSFRQLIHTKDDGEHNGFVSWGTYKNIDSKVFEMKTESVGMMRNGKISPKREPFLDDSMNEKDAIAEAHIVSQSRMRLVGSNNEKAILFEKVKP